MNREMTPGEQALSEAIVASLTEVNLSSERSQQSARYELGVSDLGTCRNRTRYMMEKHPFDEGHEARLGWAAHLGHAIEEYVLKHLAAASHLTNVETTTELPSGLVVPGHADWVLVPNNAVIDIKTVDGLYWPKREGASIQQLFQRRLYAAGLVQAGVLDDSKTVLCGNVWFDRSGKEEEPWVELEAYEPWMLKEVDDWLSDVTYAVQHKEEASKDKPYEWCEKACPFFTPCRGGEEHTGGLIPDPEGRVDKAAAAYIEGAALKKEGDYLQRQAKQVLAELNGATAGHTVKNTWVGPSTVPEIERQGYYRLTVREKK